MTTEKTQQGFTCELKVNSTKMTVTVTAFVPVLDESKGLPPDCRAAWDAIADAVAEQLKTL